MDTNNLTFDPVFHAKNCPLLSPRSRQNAAAPWPLWVCSATKPRHFAYIAVLRCLMLQESGIYETRPWAVFGEGPTQTQSGSFKEPPTLSC